MGKKFRYRLPDDEGEIILEPIRREDIPKLTKKDRELMLLWNLRLFPFLERNHNVIFSKTRLKRLKRAFCL